MLTTRSGALAGRSKGASREATVCGLASTTAPRRRSSAATLLLIRAVSASAVWRVILDLRKTTFSTRRGCSGGRGRLVGGAERYAVRDHRRPARRAPTFEGAGLCERLRFVHVPRASIRAPHADAVTALLSGMKCLTATSGRAVVAAGSVGQLKSRQGWPITSPWTVFLHPRCAVGWRRSRAPRCWGSHLA
jgi:hypothetical protein